jgi:hypothetical protein
MILYFPQRSAISKRHMNLIEYREYVLVESLISPNANDMVGEMRHERLKEGHHSGDNEPRNHGSDNTSYYWKRL